MFLPELEKSIKDQKAKIENLEYKLAQTLKAYEKQINYYLNTDFDDKDFADGGAEKLFEWRLEAANKTVKDMSIDLKMAKIKLAELNASIPKEKL